MRILYCVISRQNTILAKYASCVGNFSEIRYLYKAEILKNKEILNPRSQLKTIGVLAIKTFTVSDII